jgi:hypothetical protein
MQLRVQYAISSRNSRTCLPDGGFFTQEQFQKTGDHEPMPGQMPARGAIEVKSTKDDAWVTADGDHAKLDAYRWPQRMTRSGAIQDALKVYLDPQKDMRQ